MSAQKLPPPQRFITTHNEQGKAVFEKKFGEEVEMVSLPDGMTFGLDYTTKDLPISMNKDEDLDVYSGYLKNPPGLSITGGSVIRHVDIPPEMRCTMHRTVSLDYAVVLSGEIVLELDSGEERTVRAGEFIVQQGTNHKWVNRAADPCRILFVMVGAHQVTLKDGRVLEETVFKR